MTNVITIPSEVTKGEELVVVPRSLYEKMAKEWSREEIVDEIITLGERELKEKKTIIAKSSKEALKIFHAGRNK